MSRDARELPILMTGPLVRATLDGRKTQTRRVAKRFADIDGRWADAVHPDGAGAGWIGWHTNGRRAPDAAATQRRYPGAEGVLCPYGKPGDLLYVRETWQVRGLLWSMLNQSGMKPSEIAPGLEPRTNVAYRADGEASPGGAAWKPSILMPKAAARLWLRIESIGVEQVQSITDKDIAAEGVEPIVHHGHGLNYRTPFARLWDDIYGSGDCAWDRNPWVWVVTYSVASTTGRSGVSDV